MVGAQPYVAVEGACGVGAEIDRSNLGAFAFDDRHALVKVEVVNTQAAGFADPYATVKEQPD